VGYAAWDIVSVNSAEIEVDIFRDTAPSEIMDLHIKIAE